ncbi:SNF2 family helicase [Aspergillus steynii IBT 23096]|uniref:SNF2 family helicase n=1 Tax=Aspergillus steynii IBT 23096 TaxID=1392250 RepID=A0A2I2GQ49_9EURO|nr:SNF2 family helicase [Aspergillus steynii IBT 23096]PLB55005.1 SNF2 family helicase [Aspergillus steynii IBT 23096]
MTSRHRSPSAQESSTESVSAVSTPATSVSDQLTRSPVVGFQPLVFPESPQPVAYDRSAYIPVGVLRRHNGQSTTLVAAEDRGDNYPQNEVSYLEDNQWIWTSIYDYHRFPDWSFVRVYILPDDRGRSEIPRSSPSLRRALKIVMARIDPGPAAWAGYVPPDWIQNPNRNQHVSENSQDESLWYIFNTLKNPEPKVENMENPYAKSAMESLLSATVPRNRGENGTTTNAVPALMGLKTSLHLYQRRSAATMVQREAQPAQMLDPRLLTYTTPTGLEYYYDKEEGTIVREKRLYSEACGGILAETMGCGKTLICLAVILATRGHFPQIPLEYQEMTNPVREKTASLAQMAAATAGRFSLPWKNQFTSLGQEGSFYTTCIKACEENCGEYTIPPPPARHNSRNGVPYPRPSPLRLRLCSATLIIVPPNLVNHWLNEIQRHTEGLKVCVLRDSSDATPSPEVLLQQDIVLFSRIRFEREAGDALHIRRQSGNLEDSPLTRVHWLRIIVDEGHNVAGHGHRTNMVHMIDKLHVDRRWIVSGTPSSGLYGVEVSLASQETNTSDTDVTEATTAVLDGRRRTGNSVDSELKDLDKLKLIVTQFLDVKPWSNSRANDPANWTKYIKPVGEDGRRRKAPSLRATLQGLVVRHRMETIHNQITLPRLHNKVVHLEPTFYDKLNLNLFIFILAVNAITSERKDQDYMFHPRNRKHLTTLISNLRQAGFWWAGSDGNLSGTIDTAQKYLEKNREQMAEVDIALLTDGVRIAQKALACESWNAFNEFHELGVFLQDFPSHARSLWALTESRSHLEPLLVGITQAHHAQRFITAHLDSFDPAEGLAGAGIKVRHQLQKRKEQGSELASPHKFTPDKPITTRSPKKTYLKGLFKTLPTESPLAKTKLVATASAKLTYLLERVLHLHKEEKIIIFYDNNNSAFWIAEGLELLGVEFRIYASTLKPAQRAEYLATFEGTEDIRVLLMDLGQASHGLHIASASRVFIINPIWQPNVESQAIKRAHRIGQTRPVFVETLVLKDTLEDKILRRRKAMSDSEIQHAERDLLDDKKMSAIIQNEHFIPMPEDEDPASAHLAFFKTPSGFFDRHKLSIPDDGDDNSNIKTPEVRKTPSKRKRAAPAALDFGAESSSGPDLLTPQRRRSSAEPVLSPNGLLMTPSRLRTKSPWSSPSVISSTDDHGGSTEDTAESSQGPKKKKKKTVSIFG